LRRDDRAGPGPAVAAVAAGRPHVAERAGAVRDGDDGRATVARVDHRGLLRRGARDRHTFAATLTWLSDIRRGAMDEVRDGAALAEDVGAGGRGRKGQGNQGERARREREPGVLLSGASGHGGRHGTTQSTGRTNSGPLAP